MAQIITYKEGAYSQIRLSSGERILLSVGQSGIAIFKLYFFGFFPGRKLAEWHSSQLADFMFFFGGAPLNQTPFNYTVNKLTSFDNILSLSKFLAQKPNPLQRELQEKALKEAQTSQFTITDFDTWSFSNTLENPKANLEDQLNEFIQNNDVLVKNEVDEPYQISLMRTKLLILDKSVLIQKDNHSTDFETYILGMKNLVLTYDHSSPEMKQMIKQKFPKTKN